MHPENHRSSGVQTRQQHSCCKRPEADARAAVSTWAPWSGGNSMPSVAHGIVDRLGPGLVLAMLFGAGAALLAAPSFATAPRVPSPGTVSISVEASPGQTAPRVDIRMRAQPSSTGTLYTLVVTNESRPDSERQSFMPLILTLCGAVRDSNLEQINRAYLDLSPLATLGVFSSGLGDWRDCVYTRISEPSSSMSSARPDAWQVIVGVTSTVVTYREAGDRVRAVMPNLVSEPLLVGTPHAVAVGAGSSAKLTAIGLPTDLVDVIASPGLPDPGLLEWAPTLSGPAYSGGYRLTGTREGIRAAQGAMLFLAGAFAGLAGSAIFWALDRTNPKDVQPEKVSEQTQVLGDHLARQTPLHPLWRNWAFATAVAIWLWSAAKRRCPRPPSSSGRITVGDE